jgi:oligopeptide transport system permease protein
VTSAATTSAIDSGTSGHPRGRGVGLGLGVGWFGLALLSLLLVACFGSLPWTFALVTGPGEPPARRYDAGNIDLSLLPPSWLGTSPEDAARIERAATERRYIPGRLLGSDRQGRDVFARTLAGGAISLTVGLSAATLAMLIGTAYGAYAGFRGGRADALMMRIVDILFGLPSILLVVLLAVAVNGRLEAFGERIAPWIRQGIELLTLLVAIGGVSWLTMARVIRGQVLSLKAQPFIEAARAIGVSPRNQFRIHLLPNLIGPIAVYATLAVPSAILSESFLSFLGIGIRDPLPSWGNLAADGLSELNTVASRWWLLLAPCSLIALALLSLNFLGDSLRERFDPTRRRPAGKAS